MGIKENRLPQVNTLGNRDYARIVTSLGTSRRLPFTALKKGVFGTAENGNQGQLLRSKGNGLTEWANAGLPTDAQTEQAVSDWLDAHPEATTTVQDGSLTLDKFEEGAISFVSPEQFGAVGDGVTDDTEAWQAAVDSGYPVRATEKAYKIDSINVTKNTVIDANGADFTYTGRIGFHCTGTVVTTLENQPDYSTGQENYAITDEEYSDYTGFAMLKGTNNFELTRPYYYGGFACTFWDGTLTMPYPIEATGVSIEIVDPVTVVIKNVGNMFHDGDASDPRAIQVEYGLECVIESLNASATNAYFVVAFQMCLGCEVRDSSIMQEYGTTGTNSYLVGILDSSFCGVRGSYLYNKFWHACTTGANYLCFKNYVVDSEMYSDTADSYDDHENAIGTTIINCISGPMALSALATVKDVIIISNKHSYKYCYIYFLPTSNKNNAIYNAENVYLSPAAGARSTAVGVHIHASPLDTNQVFYVEQLNLKNVICSKSVLGEFRLDPSTTNTLKMRSINVDNTNLLIYGVGTSLVTSGNVDISDYTLTVSNISLERTSDVFTRIYGPGYSYNNLVIINSTLEAFTGTAANLTLNNVKMTVGITGSVTNTLKGTGVHFKILKAVFDGATNVAITDMKLTDTSTAFNVGKSTNGTTYWQKWVAGALTTEAAS